MYGKMKRKHIVWGNGYFLEVGEAREVLRQRLDKVEGKVQSLQFHKIANTHGKLHQIKKS